MLKRGLRFILLIVMILSIASTGIVCLAEEYKTREFLLNGDMEWSGTSYSIWGNYDFSENIGGKIGKSAMLTTTADNAATTDLECRIIKYQTISGLIGGQTYTVSYRLYIDAELQSAITATDYGNLSAGSTLKPEAGIKLEFKNASGSTISSAGFDTSCPTTIGEWQKFEFTETIPTDAVSATVHMRSQGIGTMYLDDLSIVGACTSEDKTKNDALRARLQEGYQKSQDFYNESIYKSNNAETSGTNLVSNPGFESQTSGWSLYNENYVGRDTSEYNSGNASLKFSIPSSGYDGYGKPYVSQTIYPTTSAPFTAGAQYKISGWVKTVNAPIGGGVYYNIKFRDTSGNEISGEDSHTIRANNGWQEYNYLVTMPENVASILFYVRCTASPGMDAYFDDLEFKLVSSSSPMSLNTKHTFYYSNEGDITASVAINTSIASGSQIRYSLLDESGSVVLGKDGTTASSTVAAAKSTNWTFSPSTYMEKQKKYVLKVEYLNSNGSPNDEWTQTKNIYLYDRPTALDKNNNLLDCEIVNGELKPNGKISPPFFTYRRDDDDYKDFADAGVTVLTHMKAISIELLDELHSHGMKALIDLYGDVPAGHPLTLQSTINTVNLIKDHPAVAAYMLMDEPTKHVAPSGILTYEEMLYYLEEGYKAIRAIDDVHPVYVMESSGNVADGYERTSQMCDIFGIDPYPSSVSNAISGHLASKTERAINAVNNERPVWTLGVASSGWSGTYANPENYGSAMLRYQLYDALWAGAKGAGLYVTKSHTTKNTPGYEDGVSYETVYLDTFKAAEASGEIDEIFDHFSLGNSEVYKEGSGNGYQWRAWYNDNGDMFIAVRSKYSSTASNTVTASFDLEGSPDDPDINGSTATLVNGISESTVTLENSTFSCTITKGEVSLYKITKGYTLSNLTTSSTEKSVTVECDVTNNLTAGGTVIYSFYDADGRLLTMKTADAPSVGGTTHITKTIDIEKKFAKIKVFIWNALGGLIPYSNVLEN